MTDPIRDYTVKFITNALFAELFNRNETMTYVTLRKWAEDILDANLKQSRLPTVEDVRNQVEQSLALKVRTP